MAYQDFSQLTALTRRKRKPNQVSIINQQAQNLPDLLNLKDERAHRDKMFGLQEKELTSNIGFQNEMLDIEKENQELAERLGYANIGLTTVFELAKYGGTPTSDVPGIIESVGKGAKKVGSDIVDTFGDIYNWVDDNIFDLF